MQSAVSVSLSVRPSVRLLTFYLLNSLTFEVKFLCALVKNTARVGLKVKVMCQGQRSKVKRSGRGNAVSRSI